MKKIGFFFSLLLFPFLSSFGCFPSEIKLIQLNSNQINSIQFVLNPFNSLWLRRLARVCSNPACKSQAGPAVISNLFTTKSHTHVLRTLATMPSMMEERQFDPLQCDPIAGEEMEPCRVPACAVPRERLLICIVTLDSCGA